MIYITHCNSGDIFDGYTDEYKQELVKKKLAGEDSATIENALEYFKQNVHSTSYNDCSYERTKTLKCLEKAGYDEEGAKEIIENSVNTLMDSGVDENRARKFVEENNFYGLSKEDFIQSAKEELGMTESFAEDIYEKSGSQNWTEAMTNDYNSAYNREAAIARCRKMYNGIIQSQETPGKVADYYSFAENQINNAIDVVSNRVGISEEDARNWVYANAGALSLDEGIMSLGELGLSEDVAKSTVDQFLEIFTDTCDDNTGEFKNKSNG